MGDGVGAHLWLGANARHKILAFPSVLQGTFFSCSILQGFYSPRGKRVSAFAEPHGETLGPWNIPARDLLSVVHQGCLWLAAQTVKVHRGCCELAGSEGKILRKTVVSS